MYGRKRARWLNTTNTAVVINNIKTFLRRYTKPKPADHVIDKRAGSLSALDTAVAYVG